MDQYESWINILKVDKKFFSAPFPSAVLVEIRERQSQYKMRFTEKFKMSYLRIIIDGGEVEKRWDWSLFSDFFVIFLIIKKNYILPANN